MGIEFFFYERFHDIITGLCFACWLDIVYLDNLQSSYITYILWLLDYFAFPRLSWIGQDVKFNLTLILDAVFSWEWEM